MTETHRIKFKEYFDGRHSNEKIAFVVEDASELANFTLHRLRDMMCPVAAATTASGSIVVSAVPVQESSPEKKTPEPASPTDVDS